MAKKKTATLPKQFVPLLQQAETSGQLRYGSQEQGLQGLLGDTQRNYQNQALAQRGAFQSLLGALKAAPAGLNQVYSDAGLTPEVRAQYAATPDGQRILASLARGQTDIQQQQLGAQSGQQFIQQKLGQDYNQDAQKIQAQQQALTGERGLYESSLLDSLIGDNRAARSKLNADARDRQAAADAATQSQNAAQTNALIGQGLLPGSDGTLAPLPGGKADPNAPANQPKAPKKVKATPQQQQAAASDFSRALGIASTYIGDDEKTPELRREIGQKLLNGEETIKGQPVYDTRKEVKKGVPNPNYGKPLLNPDGTAKTTGDLPGVPQINNQPLVQAALDMAFDGHLSAATVKKLHALGYAVRGLSGVKTAQDVRKPKDNRDYSRPGTAKSRSQQPG